MIRKLVSSALFVAIAAFAAYAADAPSYFEGEWAGTWPGWIRPSISQDVTLKITRGEMEGVFLVEYSWGSAPTGSGFNPFPGTVRTKGREEGDQFIFGWKNKQGRDFQITLKKHEADKAKARLDKSGPTGLKERPYNETYLNRK
jgi:hypothetical protein